jgi:hypothetical protein
MNFVFIVNYKLNPIKSTDIITQTATKAKIISSGRTVKKTTGPRKTFGIKGVYHSGKIIGT